MLKASFTVLILGLSLVSTAAMAGTAEDIQQIKAELNGRVTKAVLLKGKSVNDGAGLVAYVEELSATINHLNDVREARLCDYDGYKITGAQVMPDGLVLFVEKNSVKGTSYAHVRAACAQIR